ncbi:MAG: hypothetical protein ACRCUS_04205, partial [Anaerovoracaceae bacterium]
VKQCFLDQSAASFTAAQKNEDIYKKKLADDKGVKVVEFNEKQLSDAATFVRDKTWTKLEDVLGKDLIDQFREEVKKFE